MTQNIPGGDKAKELVDKFHYKICNDNGISQNDSSEFCAKQCALICVDEMILSYEAADGDHAPQYYYWQQVRTQIINL